LLKILLKIHFFFFFNEVKNGFDPGFLIGTTGFLGSFFSGDSTKKAYKYKSRLLCSSFSFLFA